MSSSTAYAAARPRPARASVRRTALGAPLGLCVGVLLALSANEACAAALGSLATSVGLLAALAALFVIKGWPAHLTASALSTAGAALVIGGAAAWLWRARAVERVAAWAGTTPRRSGAVATLAAPPKSHELVLPARFDRESLLADLRGLFVRVQHAWDHGETAALSALTTPEMLHELCLELPGCAAGGRGQCTEVVTVRAELLGFEELAQVFVASVEFSGLIRETPEGGAMPFRELWLLTQSKQGAEGWKLARHQALV